ncbi:MAG TPA: tetratricopeptide repeat protein [Gemmatimonadaceae bacterium]|nr:tetratricopeptide repeat protein [Gemmatimonadaceae bacterium]
MFKLHTFGGLSLTLDGQPCERSLIQRRQLALLAALAAAGPSGLSRDKLVGLMWPDRANDRARNLLDQALYAARRVCGQTVFVTTQTALALNPSVVESDVGEFNDAIARGDPAAAAAIYSGPFLDGLLLADAADFERWASIERARFAREYQDCLESLAGTAEARDQWHEARRWWRRAVDADPLSGRAARGLIESLARSGDRAGALEFARVHAALVRQELGAEVDLPIATLVSALRAGELPPATRGSPAPPAIGRRDGRLASSLATKTRTVATFSPAAGETTPSGERSPGEADTSTSLVTSGATVRGDPQEPNGAETTGRGAPRKGPERPAQWIPIAVMVVATIAAVGAGIIWWSTHRLVVEDATIPPPPPSIAVLPFRNLGTSPADEYFSDGMTEEIIAELSRLHGVRVVARTSSFAFKGKPMDVRDIGSALNVTHILEGTVRRIDAASGSRGTRLRVTAELVDAHTGYQVWTAQFDRPAGDALAIQDEISVSIMQSLQREFAGNLAHGARPAPSPAAYDLYLRGRYAWHQRTAESLHLAVDLFSRAIRSDPGYAAAYSGLGAAYVALPVYDPHTTVTLMYPLADSAASRALALDSTLSEPYAVLGALSDRRYQWRAAERAYRQALARNDNDATAHQWFGKALAHQGRLLEAEAEMRRALDLDPLSAVARYNLGQVLYGQRRYEEAATELTRALTIAPTFRAAHATLGYVRVSQGRRSDALREFELAAGPAAGRANSDIAVLAYGFALAGQSDSAAALLATALKGRAADPSTATATSAADIAIAYMALGKRDSAFAWLERARVEHDTDLQAFVASPILESLRNDPRYAVLRSRMNLP